MIPNPAGNSAVQSVLENLRTLADSEVLALRPTGAMVERLEALLEKNKTTGWSPEEQREWERYQYLEHQVRLAKVSAIRSCANKKHEH